MAYVISDECVSCGTCESECPAGAISQGDEHFVIDADTCVRLSSGRYQRGLIFRTMIAKGASIMGAPFFYLCALLFFFPRLSRAAAASFLADCCLRMVSSSERHLSSPSFLA